MKPSEIMQQIEHIFGKQPESYMIQILNDGLTEIAGQKQSYTVSAKTDLEEKKRWYALDDQVIDITKVEILDENSRYIMIPKLADPHLLLRADTDETDDSLT